MAKTKKQKPASSGMGKGKSAAILIAEIAAISLLVFVLKDFLLQTESEETRVILPILIDIAFLAVFASFGSRFSNLIGIAPMAGKIIMGIIVGPALLGIFEPEAEGVVLSRLAGVLFILFEAGLHFDMQLLKKNVKISTAIASVGVLVPLVTFALLGHFIFGMEWMPAVFLGGVFTATSVGLSVEALKRAGKLNTMMGNRIVGAAVIDDVFGVIILTLLARLSVGTFDIIGLTWLFVAIFLFFGISYFIWEKSIAAKIVHYLDDNYKHISPGQQTRLFFAALIGSAAIAAIVGLEPVLGAFSIGVILSGVRPDLKKVTWDKIEGQMHIFVGGFLVSIGTLLPREALLSPMSWILAIVFTVLGLAGKYITKYLVKDCHEGHLIGLAMTIRGEVGLVFVAVAAASGILDGIMVTASLLAVILVTVIGSILFERAIFKDTGVKMCKQTEEVI